MTFSYFKSYKILYLITANWDKKNHSNPIVYLAYRGSFSRIK